MIELLPFLCLFFPVLFIVILLLWIIRIISDLIKGK